MAENFIRDETEAQLARNVKLVEKIEQLGGNCQKRRTIDFFFYASNEKDAEALAEDLREIGLSNVQVGSRPEAWAITAEREASVDDVTDAAFVQKLVSAAAKYLAEFDGWGTAV